MRKHIYDTEKSFQTGETNRELPTGNEYLFHQQSTGSESDMTATKSAYSKDPLKKLTIRLKKIRGKKESYIQHSESEEPGILETYGEDYNSAKISCSLHGKNKKKLVADTILSGDQDATWHVLIRVIEGRDITPESLRVHASFVGQQKATRTSTQGTPQWRQNLIFTVKDISLQSLSGERLTLKVTRIKNLSESVMGRFDCLLAAILCCPEKRIVSKWIALRAPLEDNEDSECDNCGFLKVSICVYGVNDSPLPMNDEEPSEEIWNRTQLENHTLRVRLFRLHHVANELNDIVASNKKKDKPTKFLIRVLVGDITTESSAEELTQYNMTEICTNSVIFDQELFLPVQLPTVISKIIFHLFIIIGRKKCCLAQASIPLRAIYESGEDGFLPTFGPAFINFFGYETLQEFKFKRNKKVGKEEDTSKYMARILCSVKCVEYLGETPQRNFLDYASCSYSKNFENLHHFSVYCSFLACNMINPQFSMDDVRFLVSMGEYGSTNAENDKNRSSTLGALPDHDSNKYFSMPWGNHKPMSDVPCLWEDVGNRIERSNAILKVASMLHEFISAARCQGEEAHDAVASLLTEATEHMEHMLERLGEHHSPKSATTELDYALQTMRKRWMEKIAAEINEFKFETGLIFEEVSDESIRFLTRLQEYIKRLALDYQISLPCIIIKMMANNKLVGFGKIPVEEVFFSGNDAFCGIWCGKIRTIPIKWFNITDQNNRKEEFPAVLHVRMWFGRQSDMWAWKHCIQPAEMKAYLEIFSHQKKSKLQSWKAFEPELSDEKGIENMKDMTIMQLYGWNYLGNWIVRNSRDVWICSSDGRPTFDDKVFEVQEWRKNEWKFSKYTDFFGGIIDKNTMNNPGKDWQYEGKWKPDMHHNYGDKSGWIYAISDVFWGASGIYDKEQRAAHKFRRRCITRRRKAINYKNENFESYVESLGDAQWEYSTGWGKAYHYQQQNSDTLRRRRFVVEVEREKKLPKDRKHEMFFLPRLFEVHQVISTWQLRCYFLWAKNLLPIVKNSSRAFVRVIFLTKVKESLVVDNSQNPIWNETIIFDKILIPGGKRQIALNPPTILLEVRGEKKDASEVFLGRVQSMPVVICTPNDSRAKPQWHTLKFKNENTRGALLACFELFYADDYNKDELPLVSKKKTGNRFEVPYELRPKFNKFVVQILCWGVRSLKKYHFLSIRRPFLELIIGDSETRTDPLENSFKDPNFPEPLITFPMVSLPKDLELSPPLVINLFDSRAFKRKPLVGVCHITNFNRYIRTPISTEKSEPDSDWSKYDKALEAEEIALKTLPSAPSLEREGMPHLDWWSKYYASLGEASKAPGFEESGIEHLKIFDHELEEENNYNGFEDFLETFTFVRSTKGNFDDYQEKEKVGELKGKVFITKIDEEESLPDLVDLPAVEFFGPVQCLIRVYVIEARGLQAQSPSGICDPYLTVKCGKQKINLRRKYKANTVEPIFGEMIEMNIIIPLEKDLVVTIVDKKKIIADEEIGSTKIDLENRLLTKWRATVGLSKQYTIQGELQWRDQQSPLTILKRYCKKMLISAPLLLSRSSGEVGISLLGVEFWFNDIYEKKEGKNSELLKHPIDSVEREKLKGSGDDGLSFTNFPRQNETPEKIRNSREHQRDKITGGPLQEIALFILHKLNLVPEHVETRRLYPTLGGKLPCGELRMFVDLFPIGLGPIPPPLDISPRQPERYQLRIALFNVASAIPVKRSFGEPMSDLYVKTFISGAVKSQKTDVHYRSIDGCGEFNWRFVMDIKYNPWEKKIVNYKKSRLFGKRQENLVEPLLTVQLWDKNKLKTDTLLGEMVFDITNFKEGIADPEDLTVYVQKRRPRRLRCCTAMCNSICFCLFSKHNCCCCCTRNTKQQSLPRAPRYRPPGDDLDSISLFDSGSVRGWWPVLTSICNREMQKDDLTGQKKKNDDFDKLQQYVTGLLEMEISLASAEEALFEPVGRGRKEPNHSPFLPKPYRNKWNYFWLTSRIRPFLNWAWRKCDIQILLWLVLAVLMFFAVYAVVNNWPLILIAIIN